MGAKIYQFPVSPVDTKPKVQPRQTQQNNIYVKLKLEYIKETGCWTTTGAFENWLRARLYFDDYYLGYWEEYKQNPVYGDNEEGYTRWLQEEISKFYRECNNDDYFQEESYNRYDNKRKFQR